MQHNLSSMVSCAASVDEEAALESKWPVTSMHWAGRADANSGAMYLGHVAFIVKCTQVVEQLQSSHEGLRRWWIHEVKMNLQSSANLFGQLRCCTIPNSGMARNVLKTFARQGSDINLRPNKVQQDEMHTEPYKGCLVWPQSTTKK